MSYARVIRTLKEDGHADVASMKNKVAVAVSNLDSMADYLDVKVEDNK